MVVRDRRIVAGDGINMVNGTITKPWVNIHTGIEPAQPVADIG